MATGQYIGVNGVARKVVSPYVGVEGVARNVKNGYVGVDGVARLFFAPDDGGAVVLEVEKITSDTYAGETTYTGEQFILLDIYPKTNGTVSVTYGGLTKTIIDTSGAAEPNAQQVFFGTFNGVPDSIATPESGELTIDGDYYAFGVGLYQDSNKSSVHCNCVTKIGNFGNMKDIPDSAFRRCEDIPSIELPSDIASIGRYAFFGCTSVENITVLATTPPKMYATSNAFSTGDGFENPFPIIVPKGCGEAYRTAEGWNEYANYIVEAS